MSKDIKEFSKKTCKHMKSLPYSCAEPSLKSMLNNGFKRLLGEGRISKKQYKALKRLNKMGLINEIELEYPPTQKPRYTIVINHSITI